jgi:hypothetical protein
MMNKKGDFTTGEILALVVGGVVVVLIILYFAGALPKIGNNLIETTNTLSDIGTKCQLACDQPTAFCQQARTVIQLTTSQQQSLKSALGTAVQDSKDLGTFTGVTCNQLKSAGLITVQCANAPACASS